MSYEAWGDNDEPSKFDAAIEAGWIDPVDQTKALIDVMNERDRQHNEEGWTPEHDDKYVAGELVAAATCYAVVVAHTRHHVLRGKINADPILYQTLSPPELWPFDRMWWKPKDERRDLVRAAALLLAEIERIDRAKAAASEGAA